MQFPAFEGRLSHYSVQVYVAPAWRNPNVNVARRNMGFVLEEQVKRCDAMLRAAGAPRGMRVFLSEGFNGALACVNLESRAKKRGEVKANAGKAIKLFFWWLFLHNTMDYLVTLANPDMEES